MRGLFGWVIAGIGAAVTASVLFSDDAPATSSGDALGGLGALSCDQALALLPDPTLRASAASAIASGTNAAAVEASANMFDIAASSSSNPPQVRAAYARVAQCLRDRAAVIRSVGAGGVNTPVNYFAGSPQTERLLTQEDRELYRMLGPVELNERLG